MESGETDEEANAPVERDLGVTLSGGGHRASLFTLGALLYLVDSGENHRVATISSVSGGSITNAFVAQECDFGTVKPEEFDNVAAQFGSTITNRRIVSASSWVVQAYLSLLAIFAVLISTVIWKSWPIDLPAWACVLLIMLWGALFLLRGIPVAVLLGRAFFVDEKGRPTRLANQRNRTVDHVLCATDLSSAAPFYFFCGKDWAAYSPLYNRARAGSVKVGTAVRASAALPGAIPPKAIWTRRLEWEQDPNPPNWAKDSPLERLPKLLFLADGGVWNNLGTQYFERDQERSAVKFVRVVKSAMAEAKPNDDPGKLLIVDGSGAVEPVSAWDLLIPYWAEVRGLTRVMGLLYANTVRPRMRQIGESKCAYWRWGDQFDRDWDIPKVGVSITFQDNPQAGRVYTGLGFPETDYAQAYFGREASWNAYVNSELPDVLCPTLERFPSGFEELRSLCASEGTHLSTVARTTAVALLGFGYITTMRAMHLTYGSPLVEPFPNAERFIRFVSNERSG